MRDYASLYSVLLGELGLPNGPQGFISSDMSPAQAACEELATSFFQKLNPTGDYSKAEEAALKKFLQFNRSVSEDFVFEASNEGEHQFYDFFRYHVNRCLLTRELTGAFDLEAIGRLSNTGPGQAQKADCRTWVTKIFQSKLTYTNPWLIDVYRAALSNTGWFAEAEMQRALQFGFEKVPGGRIFFATKNSDIARTCCTEAGLNLLIQLAIGNWLCERLIDYFGINLSNQPDKNAELARRGSIDGSFGTTDQSSASDSIGLSLCDKVIENSFIKRVIMASRAEVAVLPNGDIERLRMISTMGNGFTFPLQTILFASVVRAALDTYGIERAEYGVFGDDVVVPTRIFDFVNRMLVKLGFTVNQKKSFGSGHFRESCGADYYRGHLVRGVFCKSLETPEDVYSTINRLARWSAWNGVPLTRTLSILWSWSRRHVVPPSEADTVGVKVPFKLSPGFPVTANYWYRYRCIVRRKRPFEAFEPDDERCVNPMGTASGIICGVYKRPERAITSLPAKTGKLGSFLRDPRGARPRTQIVTRAVPFWNYVKPDSDPGEAWLPSSMITQNIEFEREVLTHWRLVERLGHRVWEDTVEAFVPA